MGAWHQASNIKKLYGHRSLALNACSIIGLTAVRDIISGACTGYLEVADCSLGIDGRESGINKHNKLGRYRSQQAYGKLPTFQVSQGHMVVILAIDLPTFEVASVRLKAYQRRRVVKALELAYLFKVVDLPDDGLPTRPMSGSRGIWSQTCLDMKCTRGRSRKILAVR